jgi:hypothetical protein
MGIVGIAVVVQSSARSTRVMFAACLHAVDMPGFVWGRCLSDLGIGVWGTV